MELQGLPLALKRRFPSHEFVSVPALKPDTPYAGFTSGPLPVPTGVRANPALMKIVRKAAELADDPTFSLILILDDLELDNSHQPGVVVETVRQAFQTHLQGLSLPPSQVAQIRQSIQDKVSFHLAVLMVESWLFADPQGAGRAGAGPSRLPPQLSPGLDPESLRFVDPSYLADRGGSCACWRDLSAQKQKEHRPMWLKPSIFPRRDEHPKAAMAWLCLQANEKKCSSYKESIGGLTVLEPSHLNTRVGATALAQLDWESVLAAPNHMRFLRAMNNDLSEFFTDPDAFSRGDEAPETSLKARQPSRVLRNL